MTRHPGPHRLRIAALVLAATAVALGGASPVGAGPDWSKAYLSTVSASCPGDGLYYQPSGQVVLGERGASRVVRLEATYRLYNDEVTAGWNYPKLERTYRSPSFPNDRRNFQTRLPYPGPHRWYNVIATTPRRLDVKARWVRSWRRDWTYQYTITRCR